MQTPEAAPPSPMRIFEALNAYQKTAALKAAIDLDVFTHIAKGASTTKHIAAQTQASERGIRILCDYMALHGFLTKNGNSYALAPDAEFFLNRQSPAYIGAATQFLCSTDLRKHYEDLAAAVRKGGTTAEGEGTVEPENPIWIDFARGMVGLMTLPAELLAKLLAADRGEPWKVLDIAAGHGMFGVTIAKYNPKARIVALDWASVLQVAKENAERAGVAGRHTLLPGSAFEVEFGKDYDLVLVTNFLHHFDLPTNEKLLTKIHASLKPGGRIVILEFVPNEDRVSPPETAGFALIMLAGTPAGDAYTYSEYQGILRSAGFKRDELHALPPTPNQAIVAWK
jgi:2-polyprenyl-3-methyl-5-hydroxy-6-metoxy-1,4-benzoquinol methylase